MLVEQFNSLSSVENLARFGPGFIEREQRYVTDGTLKHAILYSLMDIPRFFPTGANTQAETVD